MIKNKLISIVLLLISIIFILYIIYRSEIIHAGIKHQYFIKYYYIGIIFFLFSVSSFFIKKKILSQLTTIGCASIFALYLAEGYFFFTSFEKKKNRISKSKMIKIKESKFDYDLRSKYEYYKFYKKKNPSVVLSVNPEIFKKEKKNKIFPFSGISNKETIHGNENGYYTLYKSDRFGFNNPDEVWDHEKIDYLLIGDSFTHGAFVNEENTIAGTLRQNDQNKVINIAYKGNGPLIEFATLREYLDEIKPDKVLWFYFEANDLYELTDEIKNKLLVRYLNDDKFSQNLPKKQGEIDIILYKKIKEFEKRDFTNLLKLNTVRALTIERTIEYPDWEQKISKNFIKIMKKTKNILDEKNIKLYFVYLPEYLRYKKNIINDMQYNDYGKVLSEINKLNIEIIDINKEVFKKNSDPLSLFPFRSNGHYNEDGYKLVGEKILELTSKSN